MSRGRVLLSGASGFLGGALAPHLSGAGWDVVRLVRGPSRGAGTVSWEPPAGAPDAAALEGLNGAIHLSGSTIGTRWTGARCREMVASRVASTALLAATLARLSAPPRVLISLSAVGWYGDRGDEALDEESPPGRGFLAELARAWEQAADPARAAGIRVVHPRLGVVLSKRGGMLARLLPVFRLGLGGRLGSGRQWLSWIGLEDTLEILTAALDDPRLDGAVNVVAPGPVTNLEFTRCLSRAVHRPALLWVPAPALRIVMGGFADEGLLASQRAYPRRLESLGHRFRAPRLEDALEQAPDRSGGSAAA